MKYSLLLSAILMSFASTGVSAVEPDKAKDNPFIYKPFDTDSHKLSVPVWGLLRVEKGPWTDNSSIYACSDWSKAVSLVNLGDNFTQERQCSLDQERTSTEILHAKTLDREKIGDVSKDNQTIDVDQDQQAVGTRDYILSQVNNPWSSWGHDGSPKAHTAWSPSPSSQTVAFSQNRDYLQPEARDRDILDVWKSGKNTYSNTQTEKRELPSNESRNVTVSWTPWVNSGAQSNLGSWTPATSTKNLDSTFTQTQSYSQGQVRTRNYSEGTNKSESKTVTGTNSRNATGTKNYITGTTAGAWSGWSNNGSAYGYGSYSPTPTTQTSTFSQSRSYTQPVKRTRTIYNLWKNGAQTVKTTETGTSTSARSQSRSVTVSWSGWANSGGQTATTSWAPSTAGYNIGTNFTQTHSYRQTQVRTRSYSVGGSASESKYVYGTNSRTAAGTKNFVTGQSYGAWSGYSNYGSQTGYAGWTPGASSQTSSFTQNYTYKQQQRRSRTEYNVYANGTSTVKQVHYDYRWTYPKVYRSISVSWSGWAVTGTSCGSYTPSTANYYTYVSFTQSKSCTDSKRRTRTYSSSQGSAYEYTSTTYTSTRSVMGTKRDPREEECGGRYDEICK